MTRMRGCWSSPLHLTPPIPDPTPQKTLQGSAPPPELIKTTPTGYLRPSRLTCHRFSLLPSQGSPGSCFALLCSVYSNLVLLIQFDLDYCIGRGYPITRDPELIRGYHQTAALRAPRPQRRHFLPLPMPPQGIRASGTFPTQG